jgi:RsiW-degrading membrane proteinase PrsW (M82 family)
MGFLVGLGLALLPVVPVAGAFLWIDRFEPEPPWLLAGVFVWGAVVAALFASIVNTVSAEVIRASGAGEADALATTAVLVAPLVEESAKGAAIVGLALFARREFDGVVDGIVAAGFVGVGFAFTENVLYFGRAFLSGAEEAGTQGGLFAAGATFVARGVLSPFAHPLFTVCTGIGLGLAVRSRAPAAKIAAPLAGFACAVLLHASWNLAAVGGAGGWFTTYVVLMVPVFLVAVSVALWVRAREGRLIARRLPAYVHSGWMPAYDIDMIASLRGRRQARAWAGNRFGPGGERAMGAYQRAATELAFLRERAERHGPDRDFALREQALLAMLARSRQTFAGEHFGR